MSELLGIDEEVLAAQRSFWTAREIAQQPDAWLAARDGVAAKRARLADWLGPLLADDRRRLVLTGAGSSALLGATLAPWLRMRLGRRVDAVPTTDLVGCPEACLAENVPTLLVSFARSGDSPESVAGVELSSRLLDDCKHLVFTCNPRGALGRLAARSRDCLAVPMPEHTHDRGFAMTSSYTTMLVAAAAVFAPAPSSLDRAVSMARHALTERVAEARDLAAEPFVRFVALGAGCLFATAREAALKCLELTDGRVVCLAETPLGFRHGPKCVLDAATRVVFLRSADPYTQRYDGDLLAELRGSGRGAALTSLEPGGFGARAEGIDDFWIALPYLVFCQMLAFFKALALGNAADEPCPSGTVNRVVKGVAVYPYRYAGAPSGT